MLNQHVILYLAAFLTDMAVAIWSFALTRRAADLGATPAELGLLAATWIGAYGAMALVTGRVSDRLGRRPVAGVGCIIVAAMSVACMATTRVWLLAGIGALYGAALAGFWPSVIAWLSEGASGHMLAGRLTKFSVAWNTGLLVGFGSGGVLYRISSAAPFIIAGAVFVVIAGLLQLRLPDVVAPVSDAPADAAGTAATTPPPAGRGFRKTAWLANFAASGALGGAGTMFYDQAAHLNIGADVNGAMFAIARAAAMVAFIGLQMTRFWRTRLWPLWIAQLAGAAAILWLGYVDRTLWFAVLFVVTGLVSGYTYQASIYFTLEEVSEKGKGGGFHEAMVGLGMFAGPIVAGLVGARYDLRSAYTACAAWFVLFVVAQMILVFYRRHTSSTVSA